MDLTPERLERPRSKEIIFDTYGVYLVTKSEAFPLEGRENQLEDETNVVIVSQPDWETTLSVLKEKDFGRTTVLTPELITIAGEALDKMTERREAIEERLGAISSLSASQPDATFIIGSPYFTNERNLPFNSALVYRNGEIVQRSDKKLLGNGEELLHFDFDPAAEPEATGDTTIVICRDLIGAQKTRLSGGVNGVSNYVLRATGNANLAKRYESSQFIVPGTKKLLVSSCWGVGMPEGFERFMGEGNKEDAVNQFYRMNLVMMSDSILRQDASLQQIVVCDRAPLHEQSSLVGTKPISGVFFRQ